MTKAPALAVGAERDDVADFHLTPGHDDAVDQQRHDLAAPGNIGVGQAGLNPPAEVRGRCGPAGEPRVPVGLGFQLRGLGAQALHALVRRLPSALVFRQRHDPDQIRVGQALHLPFEPALTAA